MSVALIIGFSMAMLLMALFIMAYLTFLHNTLKGLVIKECKILRGSGSCSRMATLNDRNYIHALKEIQKDISDMSQENFYRSGSRYEEHEEVMKEVEKMKENTEIRLNDIVSNISSLRKSLDRNTK